MKVTRTFSFVVVILTTLGWVGCGDEKVSETPPEPPVAVGESMDDGGMVRPTEVPETAGEHAEDWAAIIAMIDEVITRLSYKDKSGLYESEFSYLRAQETFDDYRKRGEVVWANTDSLVYIEIVDITFFDRDSALVAAVFHNVSDDPKNQAAPMPLMAYYYEGRWIRPYVSTINHQLEYEALIRQADEDSDDDW